MILRKGHIVSGWMRMNPFAAHTGGPDENGGRCLSNVALNRYPDPLAEEVCGPLRDCTASNVSW